MFLALAQATELSSDVFAPHLSALVLTLASGSVKNACREPVVSTTEKVVSGLGRRPVLSECRGRAGCFLPSSCCGIPISLKAVHTSIYLSFILLATLERCTDVTRNIK